MPKPKVTEALVTQRKRGRPKGHNRVPLTKEERKARNALYESERRKEYADAKIKMAQAIGCSEKTCETDLLAEALAYIRYAPEYHEEQQAELARLRAHKHILTARLELLVEEQKLLKVPQETLSKYIDIKPELHPETIVVDESYLNNQNEVNQSFDTAPDGPKEIDIKPDADELFVIKPQSDELLGLEENDVKPFTDLEVDLFLEDSYTSDHARDYAQLSPYTSSSHLAQTDALASSCQCTQMEAQLEIRMKRDSEEPNDESAADLNLCSKLYLPESMDYADYTTGLYDQYPYSPFDDLPI